MSILKKLAGQTAIYGLPTIIGRLLNYLLVPLYTRKFTPAEYGTVNEMYAYVSFLIIILTYGMETSLFNFSVNTKNKDKVFGTILISIATTSLLFIAFLGLFAQPIADVIRYHEHPEYITWFGLILGFDAITAIAFAKLREQNKAKTFAAIKLLNIITNIFFNIFFIVLCRDIYQSHGQYFSLVEKIYSPEVGIGYIFISNLIASTITLLAVIPFILKIRLEFDRKLLTGMLPYATPLLIAGLAGMTNETMDRILLKYLLPEDEALRQVGIYGACYKLSLILTIFIQTFRYAAEPFFFAHSVEKDARKTYARVMNYFVITCLVIFLFTMLNLDWIKHFIGEAFLEGLNVVPILLLANFCLGVFFNLSVWYKLTDKTMAGAYIAIAGAVITIVLNVLLIPKIGYVGSAWATLVCYGSMMVISYILGQRYYTVPYNLAKLSTYVIVSILLFFIGSYVPGMFNFNLGMTLLFNNILLLGFLLIAVRIELGSVGVNALVSKS